MDASGYRVETSSSRTSQTPKGASLGRRACFKDSGSFRQQAQDVSGF